ncbi:MAG: hypothetical protein LBH11_03730 [Propionibacteriaceae bacterium]|jgi:hypothetical protein|nr:hypothetical protein [Propionibacteriaceae bacterium]
MNRIVGLWAVLCSVALGFAATGCATTEHENPYAADFAFARTQTDVPEILAALEDGVITDAEYLESAQLTVECLVNRGFGAEYLGEGRLRVAAIADQEFAEMDDAIRACAESRIDILSPLYWGTLRNPENRDRIELLLECFKRFGLIDEGMSADQLRAVDFDNPPWNPLSGDYDGCLTDPINYPGGAPDLLPEENPPVIKWENLDESGEG